MTLEQGYYWIKFPGRGWWEPGSYDANARYFMLIGSRDPWLPWQLTIGPKIEGAPK